VTEAVRAVVALSEAALAVLFDPLEALELFEEPLDELPVDVPSRTSARLSSAAVRLALADSSVSSAADGSSAAINCPFLTRSPTLTSTLFSVPEVAKLSVSSTPGSTSPVPETVVCTTPLAAVTSSVDVRAELVGGVPSWVIPKTITPAATAASRIAYHGRTDRRSRFRFMAANLWTDPQKTRGKC
jgi:hypothetical protein